MSPGGNIPHSGPNAIRLKEQEANVPSRVTSGVIVLPLASAVTEFSEGCPTILSTQLLQGDEEPGKTSEHNDPGLIAMLLLQ